MKVPLFDLRVVDEDLREELLSATKKVFDHGRLILGPEVQYLEELIAADVGVKHVLTVGSGSSALYLALKALDIQPGDEVITTPFSFIITAHAIAACGAKPIFADIDDDLNICPESTKNLITSRTKAIVPMHYSGKMCDMNAFRDLAQQFNLHIVEDAAQAYGASYQGKKAGTFSTVAGMSFNPMKVLGGYGEGGAIFTNDDALYEKLFIYRHAGTKSNVDKGITNECDFISLNHKMDALQAALLQVALKYLPRRAQRVAEIAKRYNEALSPYVITPQVKSDEVHAYYIYVIQSEYRDELQEYLREQNVETKIHHTPLIPDTSFYQQFGRPALPNARKLVNECLSIPVHEKLSDDQVSYVIEKIIEFYKKKTSVQITKKDSLNA